MYYFLVTFSFRFSTHFVSSPVSFRFVLFLVSFFVLFRFVLLILVCSVSFRFGSFFLFFVSFRFMSRILFRFVFRFVSFRFGSVRFSFYFLFCSVSSLVSCSVSCLVSCSVSFRFVSFRLVLFFISVLNSPVVSFFVCFGAFFASFRFVSFGIVFGCYALRFESFCLLLVRSVPFRFRSIPSHFYSIGRLLSDPSPSTSSIMTFPSKCLCDRIDRR